MKGRLASGVAILCGLMVVTPAAAEDAIGAAMEVELAAFRAPPAGTVFNLDTTDPVFLRDDVSTPADAAVRIVFADQSVVTLGPNAELTIDEFVYSPARGDSSLVGNLAFGAMRFTSGAFRHEDSRIETGVGTFAIRGTDVFLSVDASGAALGIVQSGEVVAQARRSGRALRRANPGFMLLLPGQDDIHGGDLDSMDDALNQFGYSVGDFYRSDFTEFSGTPLNLALVNSICQSGALTCAWLPPRNEGCMDAGCEDDTTFDTATRGEDAPPPPDPSPSETISINASAGNASVSITSGSEGRTIEATTGNGGVSISVGR